MSRWNQGGDPRAGYNPLPSAPRGGRQPQHGGYNDPSGAFFEKRAPATDRGSPHAYRGTPSSFLVVASPSDALALSNCLAVHPSDFPAGEHLILNGRYALTTKRDDTKTLEQGTVGASAPQRQWMQLSLQGDRIAVQSFPSGLPLYLQSIDIEVGFSRRNYQTAQEFSADDLSKHFTKIFNGIVMSEGQIVVFEYVGHNLKGTVKAVSTLELPEEQRRGAISQSEEDKRRGIVMDKTDITFMKAADSAIKIKGSSKKAAPNAILAANFKFEDMGIGGLDTEFSEIFRRAFASRVFPPGLIEKLGIDHVKGILLHGPPGTGKTLIARQIGKMLNAKEPKIVNGPEVLSKFVGASEENIRKLFADAEQEYKAKGEASDLHIIIFDELDAIFKQRGSTNSSSGVGDTVVNQLLAKMDGVDQLNNILIIGMTNRKDMIDEALLRPGRLEVHMEISLPDENGRYQILNIHTAKMRKNRVMDTDVNLRELAGQTKNFSGAEINGLVKSATSFAFSRHVKVGTMAGISDDVDNLQVNRRDFQMALDDIKPAFGVSEEELTQVVQNGIIHYNSTVEGLLDSGRLFIEQVRTSTRTPLVSLLLYGPPGTGKTALAAQIASTSGFPFIKLITPDNMVGFGEAQKVQAITKVFTDSYKSPLSVLVVDNIERLIEWTPLGGRFSNGILQTLLVLFSRRPPKGRRLLIIATSSLGNILSDLGILQSFDASLRVPPITHIEAINHVLTETELFSSSTERKRALHMLEEMGFVARGGDEMNSRLHVGIKKLLSIIEMARQEPENAAARLAAGLRKSEME